MKKPTQEEIDDFLMDARENIAEKEQLMQGDHYEKRDIPIQGGYTSMASYYASLARAKFLNGDTLPSVRREFATAAKCIIKSFTMAYDPNDPDYVGDKLKPEGAFSAGYGEFSGSDVMETRAIDGFNYALMAADFDLAWKLAYWYQDSKDGHKMDPDVNRYTYALKYALLGELDKGSALLKQTIDEYTAKPPKDGGDINYFTLSLTLSGILTSDEALFNQGLEQVLIFHQKVMIPSEDLEDGDEAYMSDHAVALANLALHFGLNVTVEHDLLPKGLLI